MRFIDGRDLAQVIRELRRDDLAATGPIAQRGSATATPLSSQGPRFARDVARLARQAAEALDHAHANDVLHRDIKPSNLMIDGAGQLWITDFGLARVRGGLDLTRTGDALGTPRYMSPEQALGRRMPLDGRTDIYSLGVTLYELLTLRPAFDGDDRLEFLRQIAQDEPPPPRRIDPTIPVDLETIVLEGDGQGPGGPLRDGRRPRRRPRPVPRESADPRPPAQPCRPGREMDAAASRAGRRPGGGRGLDRRHSGSPGLALHGPAPRPQRGTAGRGRSGR